MPENDETANAGEQAEIHNEAEGAFKAPASQEELDRIIQRRIDRERAKFADYDDLAVKAATVDALTATNADLTAKVKGYEDRDARAALVTRIAGDIGVDAALLAEMRGDTEDELTAQANRLHERYKPTAPVIPNQDKRPETLTVDTGRDTVKQLFGS